MYNSPVRKWLSTTNAIRLVMNILLTVDTARIVCGRMYVTVRCPSVCPSACLIYPPLRRRVAAVGPASRRYRSTAAAARRHSNMAHSSTALGSKCEQCHVVSWRRKLNTDLFPKWLMKILIHQNKITQKREQEAQLLPRDRAMRRVSWNLANCHATVQYGSTTSPVQIEVMKLEG